MAAAEDYSPTHLVSSIFNFYWRLGADALTIARRALIVVGAAVEGATHLTLTVIGAATGGVEASVSDNAARPNFVPGMWEVASKARGNRGCPRKCLSRRRRRLAAAESAAAFCWLHGPTKAFPSLRPQGAFYLSKAILQELPEPVRHHLPAALLLHAEEAGGEEGVGRRRHRRRWGVMEPPLEAAQVVGMGGGYRLDLGSVQLPPSPAAASAAAAAPTQVRCGCPMHCIAARSGGPPTHPALLAAACARRQDQGAGHCQGGGGGGAGEPQLAVHRQGGGRWGTVGRLRMAWVGGWVGQSRWGAVACSWLSPDAANCCIGF